MMEVLLNQTKIYGLDKLVFSSLEELEQYIKENKIRKKDQSTVRVFLKCSKCGKEEEISILNFKRKLRNKVLCNKCHRESLETIVHYHKWTQEEKEKAKIKREKTCLEKYGTKSSCQSSSVKRKISESLKNKTQKEKEKTNQKRKVTNIKIRC